MNQLHCPITNPSCCEVQQFNTVPGLLPHWRLFGHCTSHCLRCRHPRHRVRIQGRRVVKVRQMRLAEGSNLRGGKHFANLKMLQNLFSTGEWGFEASHGSDRKVVVRLLTHLVDSTAYFWCYKSTTWGQNSINQRPPWIIFFFVLGDGFLLESYWIARGCGAGLGTPQSRAGGSGPWPRCRGCQHPPASAPVSMAIPI